MLVTAKLLRRWSACWPDDRIARHLNGRPGMTPREIAHDESVRLSDRLWVLCSCLVHLDESAARHYAIESVERVAQRAGDEGDQALFLGLLNELRQIEEEVPVGRRTKARYAVSDAWWEAVNWCSKAWVPAWVSATMEDTMVTVFDAVVWAASTAVVSGAGRTGLNDETRIAISRALEWLGSEADR